MCEGRVPSLPPGKAVKISHHVMTENLVHSFPRLGRRLILRGEQRGEEAEVKSERRGRRGEEGDRTGECHYPAVRRGRPML